MDTRSMMRYVLIVVIGIILLIGIVIGVLLGRATSPSNPGSNSNRTQTSQTPTPTQTTTPTPTASPTTTPAREANIRVFSPRENETVGRNFTIRGQARVFENQFQIRLTNATTKEVLFNKPQMTNAPDAGIFGDFTTQINITQTGLKTGDKLLLEIFQFSAKDGSEIDKVTIPLVLKMD